LNQISEDVFTLRSGYTLNCKLFCFSEFLSLFWPYFLKETTGQTFRRGPKNNSTLESFLNNYSKACIYNLNWSFRK